MTAAKPAPAPPMTAITWRCQCGGKSVNYTHRPCLDCGAPRPQAVEK